MRLVPRLVAVGALSLATGCGSTVAGVGGTSNPSGASGLAAPAGSSPASGSGTAGGGVGGVAPGAGQPGGPSAGSGASTGAVGGFATGAGAGHASASVPMSGRGYDAHHLYLGFPTNNDVNRAAPSGVGATNFGDQPSIIKAVVGDINRRGGILGRTVVPLFHDIATANLETDPTSQAQATCTAFTQDAHVVAVVNIVAGIDLPTFYSCLAQHDTPLISAGFVPADDVLFDKYAPYLYKLTAASFTHLTPVWLSRLTAMGYFRAWNTTTGGPASGQAKVGLLYPDQQPQQRIFADVKRRLVAAGYTVAKEYQYDTSSLNNESASMSNAVLQMRNAGVTHILSSESDVLLFMTAADSQHYRPRYALTSYHAPAVQLQGTVPNSQLVGSMGVGWLPVSDVDAGHDPGPVSSGETSCRKLMQAAGQSTSTASAEIVEFAICDGVRLTSDAISFSKDPSSSGLHAGLAALGSGFASALTWRSGLGGSRYDVPGAVREFAFNGSAYAYVSSTLYPL
ncbi:MAG TPA: ABC transporter substrate-binding protein [Mycobacteriales bacterium]|nr:ABC transporter substrate-binding protein [Mycobacteriales bacterium]